MVCQIFKSSFDFYHVRSGPLRYIASAKTAGPDFLKPDFLGYIPHSSNIFHLLVPSEDPCLQSVATSSRFFPQTKAADEMTAVLKSRYSSTYSLNSRIYRGRGRQHVCKGCS